MNIGSSSKSGTKKRKYRLSRRYPKLRLRDLLGPSSASDYFGLDYLRRCPRGLSSAEVLPAVAAEWEALSDAEKAPYVAQYHKVMQEHDKRVEEYKKKIATTDGKLLLKRPKWPKFPIRRHLILTAYDIFLEENLVKRFSVNNKSTSGIEETCSALWTCMSDDEKAPYMKEAEKNMEIFIKRREVEEKMREDYHKDLLAYYEIKKAAGDEESDDFGVKEFTYDDDSDE